MNLFGFGFFVCSVDFMGWRTSVWSGLIFCVVWFFRVFLCVVLSDVRTCVCGTSSRS